MSGQVIPFNRHTGEVLEHCPHCQELEAQLKAMDTEKKGWIRRYQNAVRDLETEALAHPLYETGKHYHDLWKERCHHPKTEYGPEEFWLILPFLKHKVMCQWIERAIEGAAFDAYSTSRRNGSVKRHDGWDLIFRDKAHFREFCQRAPRGTA